MKARLEYELPDEAADFRTAADGWRWRRVVEEVDQRLRDRLKYGDLPDPLHDELDKLRQEMCELMQDYNLTFDEDR
jgi:hypothetical protein